VIPKRLARLGRIRHSAGATPVAGGDDDRIPAEHGLLPENRLFFDERGPASHAGPKVDVVQTGGTHGTGGQSKRAVVTNRDVAAEGKSIAHAPNGLTVRHPEHEFIQPDALEAYGAVKR
jgi:hypothetical protein